MSRRGGRSRSPRLECVRAVAQRGHLERRATRAAEGAVRDRRRRDDPRLPHQVQGDVEHVRAEIDERTAAGRVPAREPGAEARDPRAPQPAGPRVVHLADRPVGEVLAEECHVGATTVVVGDLEHPVVSDRRVDHLGREVARHREGLLAEDVLAARERRHRDRVVEVVRHADRHDVEVVAGHEVVPVGVEVGHAVGGAELLQPLGLLTGERDHPRARQALEGGEVGAPGEAEADHPHPELVGVEGCGGWRRGHESLS